MTDADPTPEAGCAAFTVDALHQAYLLTVAQGARVTDPELYDKWQRGGDALAALVDYFHDLTR